MKHIWTMALSLTLAISVHASISEGNYRRTLSDYSPKELVTHFATTYNVSEKLMTSIIKCESNFDTDVVGDHGHSHGLVQIYLPAHPDISIQQANDPVFAVEYLADQLSKGNGRQWSCFRKVVYS